MQDPSWVFLLLCDSDTCSFPNPLCEHLVAQVVQNPGEYLCESAPCEAVWVFIYMLLIIWEMELIVGEVLEGGGGTVKGLPPPPPDWEGTLRQKSEAAAPYCLHSLFRVTYWGAGGGSADNDLGAVQLFSSLKSSDLNP